MHCSSSRIYRVLFSAPMLWFWAVLFSPAQASAYIGPGAGFAFLGSGFLFFLTFVLLGVTIVFWPARWLLWKLSGKGLSKRVRARRVVVLGLDGLEPKLVERYISEGRLPNFKRLTENGGYGRLATTLPAISPVAWSTFQTGVNPGAHNIFDFLTRDKRFYMPVLSSTATLPARKRLKIGPLNIALGRPAVTILRKSQPFWKILGKRGIFSNVLRVPISYPPEPFFGNILSAMCTPDLRGSQGTFSYFTTGGGSLGVYGDGTGGVMQKFRTQGGKHIGEIEGPPDPKSSGNGPLRIPFSLTMTVAGREGLLEVNGQRVTLRLGEFSNWVPLDFTPPRKGSIRGIARFCLRAAGEAEVGLYVSPVNVDPEKPVLPIAHPLFFSLWLAKKQGRFGTLGLMEDTWARNEGALDDRRFLEQTWLTHEERKSMFFNALDKTREGLCVCVFDASDRIQHMFWRYLESDHPAPLEDEAEFSGTIPAMYEKMDELVGETLAKLSSGDVLIVMSDHGFSSFRRGVNLNSWLFENGYLHLKQGAQPGDTDYLRDVDWSRTKAFALGLAGLYINLRGREMHGIVSAEDYEALKKELAVKIHGLRDPKNGNPAVLKVYDSAAHYRGLYSEEAPDLIVGYAPGYRVSWDSVTGKLERVVFSDNIKAWSGDHHIDPQAVPGVIAANIPLKGSSPHIVDLAPTVLDLFAVPVPEYMEGRVIL